MQKAKRHQHPRVAQLPNIAVFSRVFTDSPLAQSPRLIRRRSFVELRGAACFDSRTAPAGRPASLEREVTNET